MQTTDNTNLNNKPINLKSYTFENEEYYKVMGMKGCFFIKVSDYIKVTVKQVAMVIYEYTLTGLRKIKSYIKSMENSDILFIAGPKIAHHFKIFDLEKA